jgi:hypothetical protein
MPDQARPAHVILKLAVLTRTSSTLYTVITSLPFAMQLRHDPLDPFPTSENCILLEIWGLRRASKSWFYTTNQNFETFSNKTEADFAYSQVLSNKRQQELTFLNRGSSQDLKKGPKSGLRRCNAANAQGCAPNGAQLFVSHENLI